MFTAHLCTGCDKTAFLTVEEVKVEPTGWTTHQTLLRHAVLDRVAWSVLLHPVSAWSRARFTVGTDGVAREAYQSAYVAAQRGVTRR